MISWLDRWYKRAMSFYDSCMKAGLKLPFIKVDKEPFLRRKFAEYSEQEINQIIETRPLAVVPMDVIQIKAKREAWVYAWIVTLISTIVALPPEGILMWLGIVVDFLQFQLFVFIILQKLLYLYGCKSLTDENGKLNESSDWILLLISTVMIGKHQLVRMAKTAAGVAVKQAIQRFAVRMLTKLVVFNLLRQFAKWFGIVLTKDMIADSMEVIVPIICAIISGLISLWLFMPMTNRLRRHLSNLTEEGKDPVESVMEVM